MHESRINGNLKFEIGFMSANADMNPISGGTYFTAPSFWQIWRRMSDFVPISAVLANSVA